ncbi:MAG: M61 family metallopeptidase [Proteobacteria bacterium]|nr:M61 family metallopeptidase [Pseudomonadota bacterium]
MSTLAPLHYRVRCLDPQAHVFEVACTVAAPAPEGQAFVLPTWVPGSYLIREFARHFIAVRAEAGGEPVAIAKTSKDRWRAAPCTGPLTVTAEVYAYDLSVRTAYLDAERAYFNGGALFLCPDGHAAAPCVLELPAPTHPGADGWQVATTLSRTDNAAGIGPAIGGFGTFVAPDHDALIDHPVEMGRFTATTFRAGGVEHTLAFSGDVDTDLPRLARDLARICDAQCALFGGHAPFARYLFLTCAVPAGYGGLEHRSSTSLIARLDELPRTGDPSLGDEYVRFLGLASHEYFHSWNVKRIKPAAFMPYDLSREGYTRQLWAFEGITSYYDDLMLVRAGVLPVARYLEIVARGMTTVLRTPGRLRQSVADASFDAWIKYYRQDENTPNSAVSYYIKGSLVGLALDLTLRRHGSSLDALMQALWHRYGAPGIGVPEDAIAALASELAGASLADFFARYVDGTEDPPLAALLADVGVACDVRAPQGSGDRGGKPGDASKTQRASLGATWKASDLQLAHVLRDGAAARGGLSAGDVVVAIDGLKATAERLEDLQRKGAPGQRVAFTLFRRERLLARTVELDAARDDTIVLTVAHDASNSALAARHAWLGA